MWEHQLWVRTVLLSMAGASLFLVLSAVGHTVLTLGRRWGRGGVFVSMQDS